LINIADAQILFGKWPFAAHKICHTIRPATWLLLALREMIPTHRLFSLLRFLRARSPFPVTVHSSAPRKHLAFAKIPFLPPRVI
jgi:hypothetical protein